MPNAFFIYLFMVVLACVSTSAVPSQKPDNSIRMHLLKMHPFLKHKILSKSMRDLLFHSQGARKRRMEYLKDTVPLVTKSSFFWEEFNKDQQKSLNAEINTENTTPEHSICFEKGCSNGTSGDQDSSSTDHHATRPQVTSPAFQESDDASSAYHSSQSDEVAFPETGLDVQNLGESGTFIPMSTSSYESDLGANSSSEEFNGKLVEGFEALSNLEECQEPTSTQRPNLLEMKRRHFGNEFQSPYMAPTEQSIAYTTNAQRNSAYKSFGDSENQDNNKESSSRKNVEAILNAFNATRNSQGSNLPEATSSNYGQSFNRNDIRNEPMSFQQNLRNTLQKIRNVTKGVANSEQKVLKSDGGGRSEAQNRIEGAAAGFLNALPNFTAIMESSINHFYSNLETTTNSNFEKVANTTEISIPATSGVRNSSGSGQNYQRNITTNLENLNSYENKLNSAISELVSIEGRPEFTHTNVPIFGAMTQTSKNKSSQDHDFSQILHKTTSEILTPKSIRPQEPTKKLAQVPDYFYSSTNAPTLKPWNLNNQVKAPTIRSNNNPDFIVDLAPDPDPNPGPKKSPAEIILDNVETFTTKPKFAEEPSTQPPKMSLIQKMLRNVKGFIFPGTKEKTVKNETKIARDHSKKRCANPKAQEEALSRELDDVLKDVKSLKEEKCENKTGGCELSGSWMSEMAGRRINIKPDLTTKLKRNFLKLRSGFMGAGRWNATVRRPFVQYKNYVILVALERSEKLIATFMGECLICRQREIIQGDWLFTRHSRDCESLGSTAQLIGDVWRRDTLAEIRNRASESTTQKTTVETSCGKT